MSVSLGPGFSIVIRKDAVHRVGSSTDALIGNIGDLVSEDAQLIVLGPLYESDDAIESLGKLGLEYFEDFFDIPQHGGPVAEWCEIQLRVRDSGG